MAATSFFVTNVVQEPVLDSDNKPTYDTDGNPITKPKTVYVPYTTTITAANIDDHIGADAPVLYVEREDPIDSSKKVYRKAEIYNLNRDPRVRYEYVPDNFAQVTAVGAEFFTMTETWYDASGNEVDALNPDAVEKKVSYDPLPADHKLGDYLEAEANQLYVKLPGSITRKATVDKTDTSGNVVLDKDGNPVKVTQNVTTRFANGQDRYVPITLVRVKDEEPEPVPDEYDRYQFRKDLLVSDVRVVTNRQVTFETAIRDPEIAVDDDGNEYLLEPGSYYVDSRTLDWVSQNDPYFLYNDFQYDPSFLQQFGMDNDWILHDTLFAPTYEQDAWQYNEHPWFAATILNSADKLDPSEYTDIVEAQGNLKHAKLVFALHLPSQVTFYDEKMLTDDKKLADSAVGRAAYKYIGDYEDDDYSFYIERNYLDRKDGQMKTERLTPKQLMEKGWTVKISYQPDYGDNSYSQTGTRGKKDNAHYGKADADDPLDTVENRGLVTDVLSGSPEADNGLAASVGAKQAVGSYASVKPARHGKEVVVFEIAAPDDATDREFAEFDSLLNAYYAGAHPDGYLGYGDSMTLKVKTRLDNLGDVDSAMDDSLYEGDALVSYKKQMETIASWDGDESEVYATAHETKLNWIDDEDSEGWDHIYEGDDLTDVNQGQTGLGQKPNGAGSVTAGSDGTVAEGTTGLKPKLTDLKTLIGTSFHGQSVNRFFRAGEKAEDHAVNNVNYDRDSDLDDLYVTDTSGWFRIRKPSASVRADTAKLRSLIYNSDMDVYTGQDVQLRGSNGFYLTQAINTGGAVNSFVVDWQVPFWATASDDPMKGALTVKNAPFTDSEHSDLAVGRILSAFESVSTGIWEVPGAKYDCTYEYKAPGSETYQAIELNAKGQYQANVEKRNEDGSKYTYLMTYTPDGSGNMVDEDGVVCENFRVSRTAKNEEAKTEKQLRLFMFARLASTNYGQTQNVYTEQNGDAYQDHENFALAGSDADRDYYFGEDDINAAFGESEDYNTADAKGWVQIGDANGYAVSDKRNVTITEKEILEGHTNMQVRQIRWVVKAVPVKDGKANYEDDSLSTKVGVPHGFRLDVDAIPDRGTKKYKELAGKVYSEDDPELFVKDADGKPTSEYKAGVTDVLDADKKPIDTTGKLIDANNRLITTNGKQEADDFDPLRLNVGWGYRNDTRGKVRLLDRVGNLYPETVTEIHPGMTNGAPFIKFSTSKVTDPTRGQAAPGGTKYYRLDEATGNYVECDEDYDESERYIRVTVDGAVTYQEVGEIDSDLDVHVNHFASATPRYDDTKYVETERSRAGFIRTAESPVLSLEIMQGYFSGNATNGYRWVDGASVINKNSSRMMRYKITLSNLSDAQMKALNYTGYEQDSCANPQISQILPFVEGFGNASDLTDKTFQYVPYEEIQADRAAVVSKYDYFDWDYVAPKRGLTYPNINNKTPLWTYYVTEMDETLNVATEANTVKDKVYNDPLLIPQGETTPRLTYPRLGSAFTVKDKAAGVDETNSFARKFLNWRFTGNRTEVNKTDSNGNVVIGTDGQPVKKVITSRGVLKPGQGIVIELIMPISADANDLMSEDLLTTAGYGYKPGNFKPYTPAIADNDGSTRGLVSDTRDVNLDGQTSQSMVMMQLKALQFASAGTVNSEKTVTTQLESLATMAKNGPAGVPEGTSYSYANSVINPETAEDGASKYNNIVFYDVLPFQDDVDVMSADNRQPISRDSR